LEFILIFLIFQNSVSAVCNWVNGGLGVSFSFAMLNLQNTIITDLRTPTALAYTMGVTDVSGCSTAPTSIIDDYTAIADGVTYYAESLVTFLYSAAP
jgi:hypothetical protein